MSKINGKSCATSDMALAWEDIDFRKAERHIIKLQKRIALAYSNRCFDRVAMLQHALIHSFYARITITFHSGDDTVEINDRLLSELEEKDGEIKNLFLAGDGPPNATETRYFSGFFFFVYEFGMIFLKLLTGRIRP